MQADLYAIKQGVIATKSEGELKEYYETLGVGNYCPLVRKTINGYVAMKIAYFALEATDDALKQANELINKPNT